MITVQDITETRRCIHKLRSEGKTIGFVPTMGALHEGHISLVNEARSICDAVVMSIFVNRLQFNDPNDFSSYPKTIEADLQKAQDAGVSCVFLPTEETMYQNQRSYIEDEQLTDHLCGAIRPGHFRGVFTVVAKLFNIVQPDYAFFGQKDIQQARSIEKMVFDLNMPITIIISPIIRETGGLALSSRNIHLSDDEKKRALSLYNALGHADTLIQEGERKSSVLIEKMSSIITAAQAEKIDYVSIVDYENLQPVELLEKKAVVAVAAYFGSTRLIDNLIVNV